MSEFEELLDALIQEAKWLGAKEYRTVETQYDKEAVQDAKEQVFLYVKTRVESSIRELFPLGSL